MTEFEKICAYRHRVSNEDPVGLDSADEFLTFGTRPNKSVKSSRITYGLPPYEDTFVITCSTSETGVPQDNLPFTSVIRLLITFNIFKSIATLEISPFYQTLPRPLTSPTEIETLSSFPRDFLTANLNWEYSSLSILSTPFPKQCVLFIRGRKI